MCVRLGVFVLSSVVLLSAASAQDAMRTTQYPSAAFREQMDLLLNKHAYRAKAPEASRWLDGGARYTVLEAVAGKEGATDLVVYETATGKRTVLVPAASFKPAGAAKGLEVEDYQWSKDRSKMLIFTNSKKVWRRNTRGDFWVLEVASGKLRKLGGDGPDATMMFAKFSPDGTKVGYVRENNVYVEDVARGAITQLTKDGSADIINGTSDWVNEEELDLRDGFRWSPDSKRIAYWQFDQSGVGEFTLINDTKEAYPTTFKYKYPLVGTTNSAVKVGVVAVSGGATTWVKLPGDARSNYVPRMEWVGDGDELALEYLNRRWNKNQVWLVKAATGEGRVLMEDTDPSWVNVVDELEWLRRDGVSRELVWLSDKDGWRHAYLVDRATGAMRLITNFQADVVEEVSVDDKGGWFYFVASPGDPIRRYLYRSRLDGTGVPERVTPETDKGTNAYDVSPDGKWAIQTYSNAMRPRRFTMVSLPEHKTVRVLEDNAAATEKVKAFVLPVEFSETPVSGGVTLSTMMVKPPNFDPAKKWPVFTFVYGEPAGQTVLDRWGTPSAFLDMVAREGYVVVSFDNQGTPAPRGAAWRRAGYGRMGILSSQQQAEAIQALAKEHPYLDTTRMGIFGWSGGGSSTQNMMFRHPGVYGTGIAVAGVPVRAKYDSIYEEHYDGLLPENAAGYKEASPINFAEGLAGNLLIVHGSGDDNVHFQGDEMLENRLIELGKPFDFMDYPNRTHSISEGPGTSDHVYTLIARYLEEHVSAGAR